MIMNSENGFFELRMQTDGNLVLYYLPENRPLWSSNTSDGTRTDKTMACFQSDGNFVVYSDDPKTGAIWESGAHDDADRVVLQGDGNLVMYDKTGSSPWSSDTNICQGSCCPTYGCAMPSPPTAPSPTPPTHTRKPTMPSSSYDIAPDTTPMTEVEVDHLLPTLIDSPDAVLNTIANYFLMKCGSGSALDDLLDDLLEMSIIDFSGTPLEFLGDINIMGLLKDAFDEIVGGSLGNIIIPQKICPGDPKSLSQIGEEKHIDACARMVDVSKTKAIAFGFQAGSRGLCVATSWETLTLSFAQQGIIPVINIPNPLMVKRALLEVDVPIGASVAVSAGEGALPALPAVPAAIAKGLLNLLKVQFTPSILSLSLLRGLAVPSRNGLWNGKGQPAIKEVPGNFRFGGIGNVGLGIGSSSTGLEIKGTIEFDGSYLFDTDYSGDQLANVLQGKLFDMAFLIQGSIKPKFDVAKMWELDLSAILEGVKTDLYVVMSGQETQVQAAATVSIDLGGFCKMAPEFEWLCDILSFTAKLEGRINIFLSKDGFGIKLGGYGHFNIHRELMYGWLLDLIGWPEGGMSEHLEITGRLGSKSTKLCVKMRSFDEFCTPEVWPSRSRRRLSS